MVHNWGLYALRCTIPVFSRINDWHCKITKNNEMTLFEILNFNKELIDRLISVGFKPDDCRYVALYADYMKMHGRGEKVTYIVTLLSDKYKVSERKVYNIIKKFETNCTAGAV